MYDYAHVGARQLKAVLSESGVNAELQRSTSAPADEPSKSLVDSEEEEDEVIISASNTIGKERQKQKKGAEVVPLSWWWW